MAIEDIIVLSGCDVNGSIFGFQPKGAGSSPVSRINF